MISGIIFFEEGGYQMIGDIGSFAKILATMNGVSSEMIAAEKNRLFDSVSVEELEKAIDAKKQKKETLEP